MSIMSATHDLRWQVPEPLLLQLLGINFRPLFSIQPAIYSLHFTGRVEVVSIRYGLVRSRILQKT
jgi:hypothetical protein